MKINFEARNFMRSPLVWLPVAAIAIMTFGVDPAHASAAGGGASLPWEGPLELIRNSLSGPVAFTIALLGIIACGAGLIWGGEISEFVRRLIFLVLVICLIVFANTIMSSLFKGALIPDDLQSAPHASYVMNS